MKLIFKQTCFACPEQYDVFDENDKQVGYLRLRHGYFRVDFPDCGGETIYSSDNVKGDGCFYDEKECRHYLNRADNAIRKKLRGLI